jgi:hypothetical protein
MGVVDARFERHRMMPNWRGIAQEKEDQMGEVHILAIDLTKRSFQVCETAPGGAVLFNQMVSRARLAVSGSGECEGEDAHKLRSVARHPFRRAWRCG